MSTRITINTGGDALIARNAQQVQANRFGQLEKENRARLEVIAKDTRAQTFSQLGLNPDGTLPYAPPLPRRTRTPEPAANRRLTDIIIFEPVGDAVASYSDYIGSTKYYFVQDFVNKSPGENTGDLQPNASYIRTSNYENEYPASRVMYAEASFALGMGPNGKNALYLEAKSPWMGGAEPYATGCVYYSGSPLEEDPGNPVYTRTFYSQLNANLGYEGTFTMYALGCFTGGIQETWSYYSPMYTDIYCDLYSTQETNEGFMKALAAEVPNSSGSIWVKHNSTQYDLVALDFGRIRINYDFATSTMKFEDRYSDHEGYSLVVSIDPISFTSWTRLSFSINALGEVVTCLINSVPVGTFSLDPSVNYATYLMPTGFYLSQYVGPTEPDLRSSYLASMYVSDFRISKRSTMAF